MMIMDMVIATGGFFAGQFIGNVIGRELIQVGVINLGWGTIISFIFLLIGSMVSRPLF